MKNLHHIVVVGGGAGGLELDSQGFLTRVLGYLHFRNPCHG